MSKPDLEAQNLYASLASSQVLGIGTNRRTTGASTISSHKYEDRSVSNPTGGQEHMLRRDKTFAMAQGRRSLLVAVLGAMAILVMVEDTWIPNVLYSFARRLCGANEVYQREGYKGHWEDVNVPVYDYITNPRANVEPVITTDISIAYAVTLRSCPEDLVDCHHDPGLAFYDAAAVLQYNLCQAHKGTASSSYGDCTIYALVHNDAIYCASPSGGEYDRVQVLEDLGYYVKIWGAGVAYSDIQDGYLQSKIESDAGVNDYTVLNAWRLDLHDIVVLVDFSTLMLNRPDALFDEFYANSTLKAMYTRDYASTVSTGYNMGINPGFFLLKPSITTFDDLNSLIETSSYDASSGWGGSGVAGFDCAMGSRGVLTYYFGVLSSPTDSREIDRCLYANANENPIDIGSSTCRDGSSQPCEDCRAKTSSEIFVANPRIVCGEPWNCHYDNTWDSTTKVLCEEYHRSWCQVRLDFETTYMAVNATRNGTFHPEVFLGYCSEIGWTGYEPMLPYNPLDGTWAQLGQNIYGRNTWDHFGRDLEVSADGTLLATGAMNPWNGESYSSDVRVYRWNGENLIQVGQTLFGNNYFGNSISLSADGTVLAVGANFYWDYYQDHKPSGGYVRAFQFDGTQWVPMGQTLVGDNAGDMFGVSVDLSADGTVLATVSPSYVRVFKWDGASWIVLGQTLSQALPEPLSESSGSTIALSADGNILAVTSPAYARVYRLEGNQWIQWGQTFSGANGFGSAVTLSAGGTVLATGGGQEVHVYTRNVDGIDWYPLGQILTGAANAGFGVSVSLSAKGMVLAVGSFLFNSNGAQESGQAQVFQLNGTQWSQVGQTLSGEKYQDRLGRSVCLSADGTMMGVSANLNSDNGYRSGKAMLYGLA